jgi:polyisoprenoid-binding protein YceI
LDKGGTIFSARMANNIHMETATKVRTKWVVDPVHSEISFKVRHMMITNVTGQITDYDLEAEGDFKDFSDASVRFTGRMKSITTGNEQRDAHLRSPDFFDVENNSELTFESTAFEKRGEDLKVTGDLTIKGTTRSITLDAEFGGINKDPWGNTKAGFTVTGKISRKDFGLNWNATLETGGVMVGDEVKLLAEVQLVKQPG